MVRILYVIATLDPAGAERQLAHLCRRLNRSDFEPFVCCLTRGGPLEDDLARAGVPVTILHKRGRWDLGAVWRLRRVIRKTDPTILHTWLPTANTLGRIAALGGPVPIRIASERAADVWKGRIRRMADRFLTNHTHLVLTNAQAIKQFLISSIGLPEAKIRVIRNGIALDEFDEAMAGPCSPLPASAGLIVGSAGRLEPQKGFTFLLDALTRLPADLQQTQLWLAGSGPDEGLLRRTAAKAGISERVHFLGQRNDIPALMSRLDLFVLPSLWEGLPNAVIEAMAARRAVVATAVDGTPEAVEHERTGLLAPPRDPQALADSMTRLLRNPTLRAAYGEAGRRKVEAEFGMSRMVAETEHVYRSAIEGLPGG